MPQDPYVYPGTGMLRNNLEIHDSRHAQTVKHQRQGADLINDLLLAAS